MAQTHEEHLPAPFCEWPWLPVQGRGDLLRHPFCRECGAVQARGAPRAFPIGTIVNILPILERRLLLRQERLTEAQRRLIVLEMKSLDGFDTWSKTRQEQWELLARVFEKYTGVHRDSVLSTLRGLG